MIPCLIKYTRQKTNHQAFTLLELLMAVAFSTLLMAAVFGYYNASSQVYTSGIAAQSLQDSANVVISKIMEGEQESGIIYRLDTATSYMIPNGTPSAMYTCGGNAQATPCNTSNLSGELYYCQDSPCTQTDLTARWYYLNSTSTSVIYHHPSSSGGTIEENIFTAPTGSTLKLRFTPGLVGSPSASSVNVVEIDVDLSKTLATGITNSRLTTTSGDTSTYVLLRNHP